MKIYFGTDHAGYELKNTLVAFVRDELGYEVEDLGAHEYNKDDDYPDFIAPVAERVSKDPESTRGIVLGGSGQGEAMVANRFLNVRAVVYYGSPVREQTSSVEDIVALSRKHNDANILSLGARFLGEEDAKKAVKLWLETAFSGDERHVRRLQKVS